MPHIVLEEKSSIVKLYKGVTPIFEKSPLIRIQNMYVESTGISALFSVVVIDDAHHEFFIQLLSGKDRTTIRLLPVTDPVKTDSVKKSLALLCLQIQKHYPQMSITKSNLWDYLPKKIVN